MTRLIGLRAVQGPGLRKAVRIAADLGSRLPPAIALSLLRHDDPAIRSDACRCIGTRSSPEIVRTLLDLLDDLHGDVRKAASCALGRLGRREARDFLIGFLRQAPSTEVVDAIAPVAAEECIVLLARLARENASLFGPILDALDAIDDPRAEKLAAALHKSAPKAIV